MSVSEIAAALETSHDQLTTAGTRLADARALTDELMTACLGMGLTGKAAQVSLLLTGLDQMAADLMAVTTRSQELIAACHALSGPSAGTAPTTPARPASIGRGDTVTDPTRRGALGVRFRPGVHDPEGLFLSKERAIADRLGTDGTSVHALPADHSISGKTNPDSLVRRDPADPGTLTKFKTLSQPTDVAVKRNILHAGKQLAQHGGGDMVLDARPVGADEATILRGHARAVGEAAAHGKPIPHTIHVIMPGNQWLRFRQEDDT